MKEIKKKVSLKFEFEFDIPTFVSDDGKKFKISNKEIRDVLKNAVESFVESEIDDKRIECEKYDVIYNFSTFPQNCENLIYDEKNPESYKHFVHEYLKKYYIDVRRAAYENRWGLDSGMGDYYIASLCDRIINFEFPLNTNYEGSVRDMILVHLLTGGNDRMYGKGSDGRRVDYLNTKEEQKNFWKWVLGSKMLGDINGKIYTRMYEHTITVAELIILKCFRDGSLDVLEWIIDTYGLDLSKDEEYHNSDKMSYICHIINILHNYDIHDTYNNDLPRRKYNYDGSLFDFESLDDYGKYEKEHLKDINERCTLTAKFIALLCNRFKTMEFRYISKDKDSGDVKEGLYVDVFEWLTSVNMISRESAFGRPSKGMYESYYDFIDEIRVYI